MQGEKKTALLRCDVGDGMFEGEQIVSFKVKGNKVSAIVNKNSVKDKNHLEVDIYQRVKNEVLVGIPGETFSTTRKIWVPQGEIDDS